MNFRLLRNVWFLCVEKITIFMLRKILFDNFASFLSWWPWAIIFFVLYCMIPWHCQTYISNIYIFRYIQLHVSGTLPPTRSIHKTFDIQTHWLLADCCCPSLSCVYGMIAIWFDYKPCNTTIRTCQWRHNLLSYFFYLLYSSNLLPKTPKSAITPKYIMNKQSQYL